MDWVCCGGDLGKMKKIVVIVGTDNGVEEGFRLTGRERSGNHTQTRKGVSI